MREAEKVLQRLEWTVVRRLDGVLQGDYRTLFHGSGLDLAELREYELSDDVRYIDWNVTARMNTPYVRQYTEDRELTAWFLLDLSPSVDFGSQRTAKRDVLIDFTAVMARLLSRHGNRVGAMLFSGSVDRVVPSRGGRNHVLGIVNALLRHPRRARAPETNLSTLLDAALRTVKRRSLVFVVSDFISVPGWERQLGVLARRHEVLAVRLHDPSEVDLPDIGLAYIQDAESGEQLLIDTHDGRFRRRFTEAAARREYQLKASLSRAGVDVLELSTSEDLGDAIIRHARWRKQRRTAPAAFSRPRTDVAVRVVNGHQAKRG